MAGELTKPPTSSSLPPLPPGWTEHKAPSGHTYFYNAATKESTYKRPAQAQAQTPPPPPRPPVSRPNLPAQPPVFRPQPQLPLQPPRPYLNLSDPRVANAFIAANTAPAEKPQPRGGPHGRRPQHQNRPRHGPVDRPRSKVPIPGCEPWILVYTKYGRRFVYNPAKNQSYWRIPEKLQAALLEMDKEHVRRKALGQDEAGSTDKSKSDAQGAGTAGAPSSAPNVVPEGVDYDSSEYEEVEVTDDEDENGEDGEGGPSKRQRTEEAAPSGPVEFSEADIAFQLQEMAGGDWQGDMEEEGDWPYGEGGEAGEGGDYDGYGGDDDGNDENGPGLFKALLDDFKINPYSAWDKLMEEGKIFDDPRYTALHSMKERKAVWEEWSRERIQVLKEKKASEAKKDPKTAYFQLLQAHATTKLYWAEFKRKYRKETAMRDLSLAERDKEKWYREYTGRLKLPTARRKADLLALLDSISADTLSSVDDLPSKLTTDMRYLSLDASVRDPLVEAYIGNPS